MIISNQQGRQREEATDTENDEIDALINAPQQVRDNYKNNEYIGTIITEEKADNITRILGGNPNGLHLGVSGGDFNVYVEKLK